MWGLKGVRAGYRRRPIRLSGYDYSQAGGYFVTIVTQDRLRLLGDVIGEEMRLNGAGRMVRQVWDGLPRRFPGIGLDAFVVMPNHVHGIVVIGERVGVSHVGAVSEGDVAGRAATRAAPTGVKLGEVIGAYKSITTLEYIRGVKVEGWEGFKGRLWQGRYYERVIRGEDELDRAREYVVNNPLKWALDRENPTGG